MDAEDVPADLWQGSTAARIDGALAALGGTAPWPTAREMLRDLLATDGPAPAGEDADVFADRRAKALLMLGDPAAAVDVADDAGRPPPAGALFLAGEEQRACAAVLPGVSGAAIPAGEAAAAPDVLACRLFAAADGTAAAELVSAGQPVAGAIARAAATPGPIAIDGLDPAVLTPADLAVLAWRGIQSEATADTVTEFAAGLGDAGLSRLVMSGAITPFHRLVLAEAAATRGLLAGERLAGAWLAAAAAERSAALSGHGPAGESRPERRRARLFATAAAERNPGARLYGIATLVKAAAEADPLLTATAAAAAAPLLEPAAIRGLDPDSRIMAARIAIAGGAVDAAAAMLGIPENRPDVLSTAIAADPELTALSLVAFQEPSAVLGRDLRTVDISSWLAGLAGPAREVATAAIGLFSPEALPSPDPAAPAVEDAVAPIPAVWFALRAAADAGRLGETAALSLVLLEARPEIGAIGLAAALEGFRLAGFDDESRRLAVEMMIAAGVVSGLAPGV
ncbi:hypothetical protein [Tistrella mobilis]